MKIYLAAGGGGLVLFLVVFFVILGVSKSSRLAPFRNNMDAYLNMGNGQGEGGYRAGKLLPIDVKNRDVDDIYFDLPADKVAQIPEEVGLVARIRWATQPVGKKNQEFCMVEMYSYPNNHMLDNIRFEDRKPSIRGQPDDPDRRDIRTKMIEYFSKLKPGMNLEDARPERRPD
jgi:hypothetical protein